MTSSDAPLSIILSANMNYEIESNLFVAIEIVASRETDRGYYCGSLGFFGVNCWADVFSRDDNNRSWSIVDYGLTLSNRL